MSDWKTLARRELCRPNRFLAVETHVVALPDGRRIDDWPWVITPDFVNVLARTAAGRFICFEQSKYGITGQALAPVGGFIEDGEEPLAAARRELREESGYAADEWHCLGQFVVDPNRGCGTAHCFVADRAIRVGDPLGGDLEEQHLCLLDAVDIRAAVRENRVKVLSWVAAFSLGLAWFEGRE